MEINVTRLLRETDAGDYAASVAELGQDAGKITWNNAKREAADEPILTTEAELEACRDWLRDFGAWDAEEIAAFDADDLNALLIQYVSGDIRTLESLCPSDDEPDFIDWTLAEELASEGRIGGSVYLGDDGQIYFYMGS